MGGYTGFSGSIANPGLDTVLASWWGDGYQSSGLCGLVGNASNIVAVTNGPYTLSDFLAMYPNFAGPQSLFTATLTDQSSIVTALSALGTSNYGTPVSGPGGSGQTSLAAVGIANGQLVTGYGIQPNTTITSFGGVGYGQGQYGGGVYGGPGSILLSNPVTLNPPNSVVGTTGDITASSTTISNINTTTSYYGGALQAGLSITGPGIPFGTTILMVEANSIMLSQAATATAAAVQLYVNQPLQSANLVVYENPFVPTMIIQLYISLAVASLPQNLYFQYWPLACSYFVAHFLTLFLQSSGNPASTPGQVAASGLQNGILTSKSVGGVSAGYTNNIPAEFASMYGPSFSLTSYGNLLQSLASTITPRFCWVY